MASLDESTILQRLESAEQELYRMRNIMLQLQQDMALIESIIKNTHHKPETSLNTTNTDTKSNETTILNTTPANAEPPQSTTVTTFEVSNNYEEIKPVSTHQPLSKITTSHQQPLSLITMYTLNMLNYKSTKPSADNTQQPQYIKQPSPRNIVDENYKYWVLNPKTFYKKLELFWTVAFSPPFI
jgi:hypothetical protein